jgi:hypothetical protein
VRPLPDLVVVFRTSSGIEAGIVRSLLEAHGIMSVVSSDVPQSIFPLSVDGLGNIRLAVHPSEAEEAERIIESHRTELRNGEVVRLRDEFDALQQAIGYRFRDRGLLEHAMTHTSRANEDISGIEHVRAFIVREFATLLSDVQQHGIAGSQDYKSALQELLQARDLPLPEYRLVGTMGPDHRKLFQVEVVVNGEALAEATGPSKKEAEQDAARAALDKLRT